MRAAYWGRLIIPPLLQKNQNPASRPSRLTGTCSSRPRARICCLARVWALTFHPRRVDEVGLTVLDVSRQVHVPRAESRRVFAEEPADFRVVPAGAVVLQAGVSVGE